MNAIVYALKSIRRAIPEEILIRAFTTGVPPQLLHTVSIDGRIITEVLEGIVLLDLDVIYGIEELIPLDGLQPELDPYYNAIYVVPFERTNGRHIMNCLGVGSVTLANGGPSGGHPQLPVNGGMQYSNACGHNPTALNGELSKLYGMYGMNAMSDINTNCTVLGPNTIMVKGFRYFTGANLAARVTLTNDKNLNNISTKSFDVIGQLAELAAKSYIYNKLYLSLDEGLLSGGQELGRFASVIESYESAHEDYRNYMQEVVGRAMYLNDKQRKVRFVKSMLGPF